MSGKAKAILFGLIVLALAAFVLSSTMLSSGDDQMAAERVIDKPTLAEAEKAGRKSLIPDEFPDQKEDEVDPETSDDPERPRPFQMKVQEQAALSGLSFATATEQDREAAGVPEKFGRGVLVTKIHPDAPAAEVALRPGDVIVRANRDNINTEDDLRKSIGDREHTLIVFAREGQLMQVVLQKPFKRPEKTN